jgi:hypothetical protein
MIVVGIGVLALRTMLGNVNGRGTIEGMSLILITFVGLLRFNELYLGVTL